jgi:hypothetical protein
MRLFNNEEGERSAGDPHTPLAGVEIEKQNRTGTNPAHPLTGRTMIWPLIFSENLSARLGLPLFAPESHAVAVLARTTSAGPARSSKSVR